MDLHGGVDVDHHAALEPVRRRHAQARHAQFAARQYLGHHRHHLGGADVESDDEIFIFLGH